MAKLFYIPLKMRCVKQTIRTKYKDFPAYVIKDSPARSNKGRIIVDNNFLKNYSEEAKAAFLFHEEYHQKRPRIFNWMLHMCIRLKIKKPIWDEELRADAYAANKVGKKAVKAFLTKAKEQYVKGIIAYNPGIHPPVEERIRRL